MDFNSTIDLIIRELEEACDILESVSKSHQAPVPEIELARSKCRNAAGVIALLKERRKPETKDETIQPIINKPEKQVTEKIIYDDRPAEISEKPKITQQETNPLKKEKTGEIIPEYGKIEADNEEPEKPFVAPIIADTFSHLARFNEQLGENQEYSRGKITNLAEAIGINDRFYYIRELFNGSKAEYDSVISRLEKAEDIDEARDILIKYKSGTRDNVALKNLVDLVKRKFSG